MRAVATSTHRSERGAIVRLALGGALFAASSFLVAYSELGVDAVGFWRMAFAIVPLLIWLIVRRPRFWVPSAWPLMMLSGAFLAVDLILWHRAIHWVGPGIATVLTNFMVFFLILFGIFLFREKTSWQLGLTILVAFVAATGIILPQAQHHTFGLLGGIFGIASGLAYSLSLVVMKYVERIRLTPHNDLRLDMLYFSAGALGVMCIATALSGQSLIIPSWREFGLMASYGLCVQFLGWLLIISSVKKIEAALAGLILLLEPVLAFLFNGLLGFGTPTVLQTAAAIVVLGAVYRGTMLKEKLNARI